MRARLGRASTGQFATANLEIATANLEIATANLEIAFILAGPSCLLDSVLAGDIETLYHQAG